MSLREVLGRRADGVAACGVSGAGGIGDRGGRPRPGRTTEPSSHTAGTLTAIRHSG
ncbi:hypothetical protein [Streptomyces sp. NPDC056785]|uniref:hypothetical protein n=1 Tax=unclassified Streptomyces TaxID=2593676 RepID=UPI00369A9794